MNAPARVADWPSGLVTCTLRAPAVPAGVAARTCVARQERHAGRGDAADAHRRARHEAVPVTVMVVPPAVGPDAATRAVSAGAAPT